MLILPNLSEILLECGNGQIVLVNIGYINLIHNNSLTLPRSPVFGNFLKVFSLHEYQ